MYKYNPTEYDVISTNSVDIQNRNLVWGNNRYSCGKMWIFVMVKNIDV